MVLLNIQSRLWAGPAAPCYRHLPHRNPLLQMDLYSFHSFNVPCSVWNVSTFSTFTYVFFKVLLNLTSLMKPFKVTHPSTTFCVAYSALHYIWSCVMPFQTFHRISPKTIIWRQELHSTRLTSLEPRSNKATKKIRQSTGRAISRYTQWT